MDSITAVIYRVEVLMSSSDPIVIELTGSDENNVAKLKRQLQVIEGDFIFQGGKKLKDADKIPFDVNRKVKCRFLGKLSAPLKQPSGRTDSILEAESKHVTVGVTKISDANIERPLPSKAQSGADSDIDVIVVKGPDSGREVRIRLERGLTFLRAKEQFIQLYNDSKTISNPRMIRFLGKGGKEPLDSELLPEQGVVTLRALRTERGHDAVDKQATVAEILRRIESAEKESTKILNRLYDPESCILERRRILDEMQDAINWLDGADAELMRRAESVISKLT